MVYGGLLICLAILPGLVLMYKTYSMDRVEKEPKWLIILIILMGALSAVPAIILELVMEGLYNLFYTQGTMMYLFLENFIGVALVEEVCKYFAGRIPTWKNRNFDYKFDGMVYMVASAVGFAILENILYVMQGGIKIALMRAVLSVPAHVTCGIFMGLFYGKSKYAAVHLQSGRAQLYTFLGIFVPMIIHGFYDFSLSLGTPVVMASFGVFVVAMYVYAYITMKDFSREDYRIYDFVQNDPNTQYR